MDLDLRLRPSKSSPSRRRGISGFGCWQAASVCNNVLALSLLVDHFPFPHKLWPSGIGEAVSPVEPKP